MSDCTIRTTCRLCGAPLVLGLSLTPTPPANELVTREFVESGAKQDVFPLDVMVCESCAHVQLSAVVNPERLFRHYPYRSGASAQFVRHLEKYADEMTERFLRHGDGLCVEIGSNDGTFLGHMMQNGWDVMGVEPAENIAMIANDAGVRTLDQFFDARLASWIEDKYGKADLIVANHVFAHADDLRGIALAIKELLADNGVFVFEVGYLLDMVLKGQWDCCYHEHVSYWHLTPAISFFESLGLQLFDAERVDTQGGSIRCFVAKRGSDAAPRRVDGSSHGTRRLQDLFSEERDKLFVRPKDVESHFMWLAHRIEELRIMKRAILDEVKIYDKHIAAYGAPAKAVTFLHHLGIGAETVDFCVDDSTLKQDMYVPGKNIPILPPVALYERKPDYCLVLAWNFAEQIMANNRAYRGKWIVPLPELKVVDAAR